MTILSTNKEGVLYYDHEGKNCRWKAFTDMCEGLPEDRLRGKKLMHEFNQTGPWEEEKRSELLHKMFGKAGKGPWVEPPIYFAYAVTFLWETTFMPISTLPLWMITL